MRVVNQVIFLIESRTNSACYYYWMECLHLVLSCAGKTHNTSTASTTVTHWNWMEQTVRHTTQALHLLWFIEGGTTVFVEWSVYTKSYWRHTTQALWWHILWSLKVAVTIEDPHQMIIFKYLLNKYVVLHNPT